MKRVAVGIGCRRGCAAETIVRVVRDTCRDLLGDDGASPIWPDGLFTFAGKRGEPGLREAAAALNLPLTIVSPAKLEAQLGQVMTRSDRVAQATGVPSVAEAAALAGAGSGARLLGPRVARDGVTCAVAVTGEGA